MESKKNAKCELTGMDKYLSFLKFFNFIPWLLLIEFIIKVSMRSRKENIVLPSFVSYRTYGGVSCAQICLDCLHAYGIPTNLMNCYVDVEKVGEECFKFIEAEIAIPSNRAFQADVLLRQHAISTYSSVVVTSSVRYSNNIPSTRYQNNPPMIPKGIPFKPFTISDKITFSLLGLIYNDGMKKVRNGKPKDEIGRNPRKEIKQAEQEKYAVIEQIDTPKKRKKRKTPVKKVIVKTSNPKKAKLWKG